MTLIAEAPPRVASTPRATTAALARIEGRRMLRHPAPWLGLALMAWWTTTFQNDPWTSARYTGIVASFTPLLIGISLASTSVFARELVPVADEAPAGPAQRSVARLLAGLGPVALTAVVVVVGTAVLHARGGVDLGDEPGRTLHAHYTFPELLQPVLLACVAVAAGAAAVHVLRRQLAAAIVLVVGWFLVGATYWIFGSGILRWLAPVQPQPLQVRVGPWDADPTTFPSDWLLSAPGEFQDHWARIVVSPAVAAWHDVYLVGLAAVLAGIAVPGRLRPWLLAGGLVLAGLGVGLQQVVAP